MSIVGPDVRDGRSTPAERRQLTVLFCDLVGSTRLSTTLDPEDLLDLMVAFQQFCVRQIEDAGGYVARFAGDGVLAYFGYPTAQEDAPQRALHAGLAMREAGEHLRRPDTGAPIAVRVGIATGLVAVGDLVSGGARETTVAGETPNMAARLQELAAPDTVLVSNMTKLATDGLFVFRGLGPVQPKGFPSATAVWEVVDRRLEVDRYDGRRTIGLSPLVGREPELADILAAWASARDGEPGVVGILGEPGIGKSRLLDEARRRIAAGGGDDRGHDGALWLQAGGASIYDNTPFHVATQLARQLAAAGLLDDGHAGDPAQRDAYLERMTSLVAAVAGRRPTIIAVEDLHWTDPSTLELLEMVLAAARAGPLLLIYTSRTDVALRWPEGVRRRTLKLTRLDPDRGAALARAAGGNRLSLAQADVVARRAAGIPLYLEELARLIADQPAVATEDALPPTLSDLLAARLDAAGPAKRHAQVAAVLGQEFSASLFAAMTGGDAAEADAVLDELEARAVIVRRAGEDTCAFRHALLADAAHGMLLNRERRALHETAARIITEQHPELADARPEVVARHWTLAGRHNEALAAWQMAGGRANGRRAFREAEHAYRGALAAVAQADLADRDRVELTLRAAFNRVVQITQGYSASEAGASSERAAELAERMGDPGAQAREEQVKWRSVFVAGHYAKAEAIVARVMALTEDHGEALWRRTFRLRTSVQHGWYTGDLDRAERDFLAWADVQDGRHRGSGDDALTMGIGGLTALMRGQYDQGLARIRGAFEVAERLGNPYDLAMASHTEACFHHFAEDGAALGEAAARLAHVAADGGFEYASHLATGWLAIVDLEAGRLRDGLERALATLRGIDRLGAGISKMFWLGVLAQAQWRNGDPPAAEKTFREAHACNREELAFAPVTRIARARLLAAAGREDDARREFGRAARISAAMGADQFRFRALLALAALAAAASDDPRRRRVVRDATALSGLDHCRADRARFAALAGG